MSRSATTECGSGNASLSAQVYSSQFPANDTMQPRPVLPQMLGEFPCTSAYNSELSTIWEVPESSANLDFDNCFMAPPQPPHAGSFSNNVSRSDSNEIFELRQEVSHLRTQLEDGMATMKNELSEEKERLCEEIDTYVKYLKEWSKRLQDAANQMNIDRV